MRLTRPNLLNIILGGLVLSLKEKFTRSYLQAPAKIGSYTLVNNIKKTDRFKNTTVGKYTLAGNNYLIKYWHGRIPDMKYYFMIDEYISTSNLYKLLSRLKNNSFSVPQPIEMVKSKAGLYAVYEYIPGKLLKAFSNTTQATVISKVINSLNDISKDLSLSRNNMFPKRQPLIYLVTFPVIALLMLIINPEEIGIIFSSAALSFLPLSHLLSSNLILSHRDLTPNNVLISSGKPYLLDCENLVLTVPGYDVSYLNSLPGYTSISNILKNKFNLSSDPHLRRYITLQQSIGSKSHAQPYLSYLRKSPNE